MAARDGWDANADGTYPMVRPRKMNVAEMGLHVGLRFEYRKPKAESSDAISSLQLGLTPQEARDLAAALTASAEACGANGGQG